MGSQLTPNRRTAPSMGPIREIASDSETTSNPLKVPCLVGGERSAAFF